MIDTKAIRNKILDLAVRGKLTEQLPETAPRKNYISKSKQKNKP